MENEDFMDYNSETIFLYHYYVLNRASHSPQDSKILKIDMKVINNHIWNRNIEHVWICIQHNKNQIICKHICDLAPESHYFLLCKDWCACVAPYLNGFHRNENLECGSFKTFFQHPYTRFSHLPSDVSPFSIMVF